MNRIEKIARQVVAAELEKDSPAQKAIKNEIRENLKDALKCSKDFEDKAKAREFEKSIKEVADLLGIKL